MGEQPLSGMCQLIFMCELKWGGRFGQKPNGQICLTLGRTSLPSCQKLRGGVPFRSNGLLELWRHNLIYSPCLADVWRQKVLKAKEEKLGSLFQNAKWQHQWFAMATEMNTANLKWQLNSHLHADWFRPHLLKFFFCSRSRESSFLVRWLSRAAKIVPWFLTEQRACCEQNCVHVSDNKNPPASGFLLLPSHGPCVWTLLEYCFENCWILLFRLFQKDSRYSVHVGVRRSPQVFSLFSLVSLQFLPNWATLAINLLTIIKCLSTMSAVLSGVKREDGLWLQSHSGWEEKVSKINLFPANTPQSARLSGPVVCCCLRPEQIPQAWPHIQRFYVIVRSCTTDSNLTKCSGCFQLTEERSFLSRNFRLPLFNFVLPPQFSSTFPCQTFRPI